MSGAIPYTFSCTDTGNGTELHAATLQAISFLIAAEVMPNSALPCSKRSTG